LDTAAHRQRDKYSIGRSVHHINNNVPVFVSRGNVQKHQLIRARIVVNLSHFYRIASILKVDKIDTFDHATGFHIQTRQNSFRQHKILVFLIY
jgi:hypothetical protein